MPFTFPADKKDFTGDNGITYHWDGEKWVVKSYEITAINEVEEEVTGLAQRVSEGEEKHEDLEGRVSRGESAQVQIAEQVISNQNAIDELRITKGSVSKYVVKQVTFGVATRNGELIVDSAVASDVTMLSFAPFDVNGQATKPIQKGDIIEFIQAAIRNVGDVTRYRVSDAPNQQTVSVDYLAGNNDFEVGEPEECYIYPQNVETASVEYVDAQDALKVNKAGDTYSGYLDFEAQNGGARFWRGNDKYFSIWSFQANETRCRINPGRDFKLTAYETGDDTEKQLIWWDQANDAFHVRKLGAPERADDAAPMGYVDDRVAECEAGLTEYVDQQLEGLDFDTDVDGSYLSLAGGTLDGELLFSGGSLNNNLSIYPNRGNDDSTVTALNGSSLRFRTSPTNDRGDAGKKTHMEMGLNDLGEPVTNIYHLAEPTESHQPATRAYVDQQAGGGVPAGCIMIWMNSDPPAGWFKLHGGTFDTAANPQLHAYLQGTTGYVAGTLPDWSGRYPGEYGDHINNPLGSKQNQKTAKPSGGAPKSSKNIPDGTTRTFTATGNTNAYSNGIKQVSIDSGWDSVTRPPTVVVHYIIKGG